MNDLQKIIKEVQYRTNKSLEKIAEDIDYRRPYLNDQVNKGDNDGLKALLIKKYSKYLKDYLSDNDDSLVLNDSGDQDISIRTILAQQNKLIVSMNKQAETSTEILRRMADNVESRVEKMDVNLTDALGRVDSLKMDLVSARQIVLQSLARLENKPVNSLVAEADNIIASLLGQQLNEQNKTYGKHKTHK